MTDALRHRQRNAVLSAGIGRRICDPRSPTLGPLRDACENVGMRTSPLDSPRSARSRLQGCDHPSTGAQAQQAGLDEDRGGSRRLLVISHPAVVNVNQEIYRELGRRGWDVTIVVPSRWRHEYSRAAVHPAALEGMQDALRPTPVLLAGRPQRHVYLTSCRMLCARSRPDVAFVEAEPYALAAMQWGRAFAKRGTPFGVQCYENIDRPLPLLIRRQRARVLRQAAFVAARSDSAARLACAWGGVGEVAFAPPAVPAWERLPAAPPQAESKPAASGPAASERPFTVGYAGRLIKSKGLMDLLTAVRRLEAPVEMLLIGDGELSAQLHGQQIPGSQVRVLDGLGHDQMASGYAQLDVLVLPSRTTPTWKEQFGRAIVEALWCGVPVVGSDSGEIPWLIGLTKGGLLFPEGDSEALASRLTELREFPALRERLVLAGRSAIENLFSVPAATDSLERLLTAAAQSRPAPR
jgi:glycosyltransferase involved in cell wall biosynthesis